MAAVITIPKELIKEKELVLIPRKKYEELLRAQKGEKVAEGDILRWAKEARMLKKIGRLPRLRSLAELKK